MVTWLHQCRAADAKYAWRKMDGFRMDGRRWKVDWASYEDFKMFGWKWFEERASPYRGRSRSRSRSPPVTPHDTDRKADKSNSPRREASRSRSPAPRDD
jgi:arginine/serine-rich splicing factor 2